MVAPVDEIATSTQYVRTTLSQDNPMHYNMCTDRTVNHVLFHAKTGAVHHTQQNNKERVQKEQRQMAVVLPLQNIQKSKKSSEYLY